ncbi:cell division protein FtsL [Robbsia sp. KACC 23696]|uniref:cell division protein FtsL n=1 Tax=Robbsia sp. KACC 23696 TaxID=3149231 RepID=UPI00325B13FC
MSRLDAFLLLALIACALSVVNSTYQQRRVFVDLERAQGQQQSLQQDWTRLQYEQSALSKTSRVEDISSNQLTMSAVTAGRTEYLNDDGSAVKIAPMPASVSAVTTPAKSDKPAPPVARSQAPAQAIAPKPAAPVAVPKSPAPAPTKSSAPSASARAAASSHAAHAADEARASHAAQAARAARDERLARENRAAAAAAEAIMSGKSGAMGGGRP